MTRSEHLHWAIEAALDQVNHGKLMEAVTGMVSDLDKHPELGCDPYLFLIGTLYAEKGNRHNLIGWILGFH